MEHFFNHPKPTDICFAERFATLQPFRRDVRHRSRLIHISPFIVTGFEMVSSWPSPKPMSLGPHLSCTSQLAPEAFRNYQK